MSINYTLAQLEGCHPQVSNVATEWTELVLRPKQRNTAESKGKQCEKYENGGL